ncbi:hypothetical protein CDAR_539571 [Caerostris darwini]|uniref:Uncharacterized protein n=1 Tax=Caerostris darwini TaxID=1538125 RepID=A0AAV4N0D6_9ARAC|nr:hypothetical protein CDAR_539571 [Caerostris darwini]
MSTILYNVEHRSIHRQLTFCNSQLGEYTNDIFYTNEDYHKTKICGQVNYVLKVMSVQNECFSQRSSYLWRWKNCCRTL